MRVEAIACGLRRQRAAINILAAGQGPLEVMLASARLVSLAYFVCL